MLGALADKGFELTVDKQEADLILINTCTFIKDARDETESTINEFIQWKQNHPERKLLLAGCHVQREKEKVFEKWPEVDGIVGVGDINGIKKLFDRLFKKDQRHLSFFSQQSKSIEPRSPRLLTSFSATAYLKIADGCNNHCTYCIIPSVRGVLRSRSQRAILSEARELVALGIKECILIAQDIGAYGQDLPAGGLVALLRGLLKIEGFDWIRLLYLYPDHLTDELVELIATESRICKYVDIPMQHVSDRILRLMNRRGTAQQLKALVLKLRERIPGIVIRSTFIVGFPQETQQDFEMLLSFLKECQLDRVGFFSYSPEEGTPAATFAEQVPPEEIARRLAQAQQVQQVVMDIRNSRLVGSVHRVLPDDGTHGRYYGQAPEIDGMVLLNKRVTPGEWINVKLISMDGPDFIGDIVNDTRK